MAMGMRARNPVPGIENPRSLGWRSWCALMGLLEHLGADMSEASLENDGAPVGAETARGWADRLRPIVGRAYVENYQAEFQYVVDGVAVPPWPIPDWFDFIRRAIGLPRERTTEPVEPPNLEEDTEFLEELVRFFSECGGFEQV